MTLPDQLLRDAIRRSSEAFPFEGYAKDESELEVMAIAGAIWAQQQPPATLLDIGCGPMNATGVFAQLGYACSAVDDLSDPWHMAGDNVAKIIDFADRVGIDFHRQSAAFEIPFEKDSFDVVLVKAVIEHLHESPRGLLNTAFDHARPGGLVVVTTPNAVNIRKRLSVLRGRTNYPPVEGFYASSGTWRGHVREYTLAELVWTVEAVGGQVVDAQTFHAFIGKLPAKLRAAYQLATRLVPGVRDSLLVAACKPQGWKPDEYNEETYWESVADASPGARLMAESDTE